MMLYSRSHSTELQIMSRAAFEGWTCCTLWEMGMGRLLECEGKQFKWLASTMSLPGLYQMV